MCVPNDSQYKRVTMDQLIIQYQYHYKCNNTIDKYRLQGILLGPKILERALVVPYTGWYMHTHLELLALRTDQVMVYNKDMLPGHSVFLLGCF